MRVFVGLIAIAMGLSAWIIRPVLVLEILGAMLNVKPVRDRVGHGCAGRQACSQEQEYNKWYRIF